MASPPATNRLPKRSLVWRLSLQPSRSSSLQRFRTTSFMTRGDQATESVGPRVDLCHDHWHLHAAWCINFIARNANRRTGTDLDRRDRRFLFESDCRTSSQRDRHLQLSGVSWLPALFLVGRVPGPVLIWMATGGVLYTVGVAVLINDHRIRYLHAVWHLLVMAAASCHYWAIYCYVASVA